MTDSNPFELARTDGRRLLELFDCDRLDAVVVLGSGLGQVADQLGFVDGTASTDQLEHAPVPAVAGHAGHLVLVRRAGRAVLVASGRAHYYEGHSVDAVCHLVRASRYAGARAGVLTNAVGSLHEHRGPGSIVTIADHLNLTGANPLRGRWAVREAPVFLDLGELWSPRARTALVAEGIDEVRYAQLVGPTYETPAEIDMLACLGADTVGMSCTLEAIAAKHLGMEVCGIQMVSNLAAGIEDSLDHEEVLAAGRGAIEPAGKAISAALDVLLAPPA